MGKCNHFLVDVDGGGKGGGVENFFEVKKLCSLRQLTGR